MTTRLNMITILKTYFATALVVAVILSLTATIVAAQTPTNTNVPPGQKMEVGQVDTISGNSLTVSQKDQKKSTAEVDKNTKFISVSRRILKLSDIKPKDTVVVISTASGTATGSAKTATASAQKALKVFVKEASAPAQLKRQAVQGTIASASGNTVRITHPVQKDRTYTVMTDKDTVYKTRGGQDSKLVTLTPGQRIIVVGQPRDDGSILAKRIHVIPSSATPGPKTATPSATPTKRAATPTPRASASATPTRAATASATTQ